MAQAYAQGDSTYITHTWPLWMVLGIELWFKAIFLQSLGRSPEGLGVQELNVPQFTVDRQSV
jgi:hypothetical protein